MSNGEIESRGFMHHLPYKNKLPQHKQGVNETKKEKKRSVSLCRNFVLIYFDFGAHLKAGT